MNFFTIKTKQETFVEGTEDAYKLKDFTPVSLGAAQHLIDEAAEIKFIPRQIMHEHIFGEVRFTEHKGVKVDLLNELTKGGEVKVIDDYIPRGKFFCQIQMCNFQLIK